VVEAASHAAFATPQRSLTVVQDRVGRAPSQRARFLEACEQAYHFGKGKLAVREWDAGQPVPGGVRFFSNRLHCARCDLDYREPGSALFSFNHPVGACPACKGFGRTITIDYALAIPDRSLSLAQGAVRPWRTGFSAECQNDLRKFCKARRIPLDVPFEQLSPAHQQWVIEGDPDYGIDDAHEWPHAWYGLKGYFRWLEGKAYKMHVRVLLSRYRAYRLCAECQGQRFQPEALLYRLPTPASRRLGEDTSKRMSVPKTGSAGIPAGRPSVGLQPPAQMPALPAQVQVEDARVDAMAGAQPSAAEPAPSAQPPDSLSLADFYLLPIADALRLIEELSSARPPQPSDPLHLVLGEVRSRLRYLAEVGLGYLTLDRPTRTLSGGETERVNLTTCLGTRLVNTLYVLDEPSVGLHPRDTARLIGILENLRDLGNTVVVVEHEASVMRAANQIVDLGPGSGQAGGHVVFQGGVRDLLRHAGSLTGAYLSGKRRIPLPPRRPVPPASSAPVALSLLTLPVPSPSGEAEGGTSLPLHWLRFAGGTLHNLKNPSAAIPLNRFVCLTGVSGSGKTTLAREVLLPALETVLNSAHPPAESEVKLRLSAQVPEAELDPEAETTDAPSSLAPPLSTVLTGWNHLGRVLLVDQSPLGKTPRSNPAVYIGAFDDIRDWFAQTDSACQRGLSASAFSFNSAQGQCERCRGAGFEKIEMQFLSDVFIRCPDCNGRRYRQHILDIRIAAPPGAPLDAAGRGNKTGALPAESPSLEAWSIADLLDATADDGAAFLSRFPEQPHAQRALAKIRLLQEAGLGYLRLGQPINTLSGGESQRLKLVSHLAAPPPQRDARSARSTAGAPAAFAPTLFIFDEPTTGLHFEDVRKLLQVFQRLVDAGHSLLVIEHNLDVIKCADWVIDLGPEAGAGGGQIVVAGTPEQVAACEASHTGRFLRESLDARPTPPTHPRRCAVSRKRNVRRAGDSRQAELTATLQRR
jgi:excinuclease ABC subunit A